MERMNDLHLRVARVVARFFTSGSRKVSTRQVFLTNKYCFYFDVCLIHVYSKMESFESEKGNFDGWLYRVVMNKCIDEYRKSVNRPRTTSLSYDPAELEGACGTADGVVHIDLDYLDKAVAGLNSKRRAIITSHYYKNMSYAEIAEKFGLAEASIGRTLFRARKDLRKQVEQLRNAA